MAKRLFKSTRTLRRLLKLIPTNFKISANSRAETKREINKENKYLRVLRKHHNMKLSLANLSKYDVCETKSLVVLGYLNKGLERVANKTMDYEMQGSMYLSDFSGSWEKKFR